MWRSRNLSVGLMVMAGIVMLVGADQSPRKIYKQLSQQRLLQQRLETVRKVFEQKKDRLQVEQKDPSELFGWSERWLDAELALAATEFDRREAFKNHLNRTLQVEANLRDLVKTGQAKQEDVDAATYYRLEAEIRRHTEVTEPQVGKAEIRLLTDGKEPASAK